MRVWVQDIAERRLPAIRRDPLLKWVSGLGAFSAAFALRWVLDGILPVGVPFVTFYFAILAATLLGGPYIGFTVLGLSFASSWYFFLDPSYSFALNAPTAAALSMFAIFGALIVAIAHELNITVDRLILILKRS